MPFVLAQVSICRQFVYSMLEEINIASSMGTAFAFHRHCTRSIQCTCMIDGDASRALVPGPPSHLTVCCSARRLQPCNAMQRLATWSYASFSWDFLVIFLLSSGIYLGRNMSPISDRINRMTLQHYHLSTQYIYFSFVEHTFTCLY